MTFSLRIFFFMTAFLAFSLGFEANPFKGILKPDSQKFQAQYRKMNEYYYNGNQQGALALAKEIRKMDPRDAKLEEQISLIETSSQRPASTGRLPAALRDSYFDAISAYKKGNCEEVKADLAPLERYTKKFTSQSIYENCQKHKKITE